MWSPWSTVLPHFFQGRRRSSPSWNMRMLTSFAYKKCLGLLGKPPKDWRKWRSSNPKFFWIQFLEEFILGQIWSLQDLVNGGSRVFLGFVHWFFISDYTKKHLHSTGWGCCSDINGGPQKEISNCFPRIMGMGCFFRQKNTVYRFGNAVKNCVWTFLFARKTMGSLGSKMRSCWRFLRKLSGFPIHPYPFFEHSLVKTSLKFSFHIGFSMLENCCRSVVSV